MQMPTAEVVGFGSWDGNARFLGGWGGTNMGQGRFRLQAGMQITSKPHPPVDPIQPRSFLVAPSSKHTQLRGYILQLPINCQRCHEKVQITFSNLNNTIRERKCLN